MVRLLFIKFSGVEVGRGGQLTPFPNPAHRTVHADFPHTALRLDSFQGTRRRAQMNTTQPQYPEFTKHRSIRETAGGAPPPPPRSPHGGGLRPEDAIFYT